MLFLIILLALSLSLDALGIGISYGVSGVKVPFLPKVLICFSSVIYAMIGILFGKSLVVLLGMTLADKFGIGVLLLMGLWMISKANNGKPGVKIEVERMGNSQPKKLLEIVLKSFGITIMVIKNPMKGDIDNSGLIDIKEAILLGIALNVDAMVACMGSFMVGMESFLIPVFIGVTQIVSIDVGLLLGKKILNTIKINYKLISIFPGIILILLGLIRLMIFLIDNGIKWI